MNVRFEIQPYEFITPRTLFRIMVKDLERHWRTVEEMPFGAYFEKMRGRAVYETCCGNIWAVELRRGKLYLEYNGSRLGFYARTPWNDVLLDVDGWEGRLNIFVNEKILTRHRVVIGTTTYLDISSKTYCKVATSRVVKYKTSTPREWGVTWYELIIPLEEDRSKAVIVNPFAGGNPHHFMVRRVVPYKNVYTQ